MNQYFQNPPRMLLITLAFYGAVLLLNLGGWGVIESSEARYSEISREMSQSGDWLHPTLLGIHHYHKPPVTYWITAVAYNIFGANSFGTRFFLTTSFLVQIVLVYKIASTILGDEKMGFYTAIIYSSLPIVLVSVRGLSTDSYLNTFVLLTIFSWLQWRTTSNVLYIYLVSISLGVAFLIKGPVALIIPVLVSIGLSGVVPSKSFSLHHFLSIVVFLVVASSWFVILVLENKDFVDYFLFRHTVERFANAEVFTRKEPWWYYVVYAPLLALPWILTIPFWFRTADRKELPKAIKRIAIFWVLIPLGFFSLSSSKLVLYIVPLYAGLAILCAWCLTAMSGKTSKRFENSYFIFSITLTLVIAIGSFFALNSLSVWIQILPLAFVITAVIVWYKITAEPSEKILIGSAIFTAFLILFSSFMIGQDELKFNSTSPLSDWIVQNKLTDRQIIVYDRLLPSISFDLQKDIISVSDGNRTLNREVQFEKNDDWKNSLFYLNKSEDVARLKPVLQAPCVIIVKGEVKKESLWITERLTKKKEFEGWTIYYN